MSGSNINYYDFKDLEKRLAQICIKLNCLRSDLIIGVTTDDPPVTAPADNEPVLLINLTIGFLYYWDGNSWEVVGSTDTNLANTNLNLTGNRNHDGDGFELNFFDLSQFEVTTVDGADSAIIGSSGSLATISANTAAGSSSVVVAGGEVNLDSSLGLYTLLTSPPEDLSNDATHILGRSDVGGYIYKLPIPGAQTVITPAQITSTQNNYNPTGWDTATIVRLSGDSNLQVITGFSTASVTEKTLINVGSFSLILSGKNTASSAANRLNLGYGFILAPGRSIKIYYDPTDSVWRTNDVNIPNEYIQHRLYLDAGGSVTGGAHSGVDFSAAGGSFSSNTTAPYGISWQYDSQTLDAVNGVIYSGKALSSGFGDGYIITEAIVRIPVLSTALQRFVVFVGMGSTTFLGANSFGLLYSDNVNSGNWQITSLNGASAQTTADTGIAVAANTMYKIRLELNKATTTLYAYINEVFVGSIVPTLSAATSRSAISAMRKDVGTTSTKFHTHGIGITTIRH